MRTTVKWFNAKKGFGFLENGEGPDIFVNGKGMRGLKCLQKGETVEFDCYVFDDKLTARDVRLVTGGSMNADMPNESDDDELPDDNIGNREQPTRIDRPRFVMR